MVQSETFIPPFLSLLHDTLIIKKNIHVMMQKPSDTRIIYLKSLTKIEDK